MIPKVDEATLRRFAEGGKTLMEASMHFGVPYGSMTNWCQKYGITFRNNGGQRKVATEKAEIKREQSAKVVAVKQDKLNELYREVVEIRFHMRRLAYKEKQLLGAISEERAGGAKCSD